MGWSWITEYADGSATDVVPNMALNKASDQVFTLYSVEHALTAYEQISNFVSIHGWVCPINPLACKLPPVEDLSAPDVEAILTLSSLIVWVVKFAAD